MELAFQDLNQMVSTEFSWIIYAEKFSSQNKIMPLINSWVLSSVKIIYQLNFS